jgi:hypothetical protein
MDSDHPFCLQCGELAPFALTPGAFSLEIQEVPSKVLRSRTVSLLKNWFPQMEVIRADKMLGSRTSVLLTGVDEASAERLLRALRPLKVSGRIIEYRANDWWRFLWNPGLILSVPAVVAAWGLDGVAAALSMVVAVAAPVVGALLERSGAQPIIRPETLHFSSGEWLRLAKEYSQTVRRLSPEDSVSLRSIFKKIFDLQKRLSGRSLAASAAGSEKGELYGKLMDAMRTAIQLCKRIAARDDDEAGLREELGALDRLLTATEDWYTGMDTDDRKPIPQLAEEIGEITSGIDRIVREVRNASDQQSTASIRPRILE